VIKSVCYYTRVCVCVCARKALDYAVSKHGGTNVPFTRIKDGKKTVGRRGN